MMRNVDELSGADLDYWVVRAEGGIPKQVTDADSTYFATVHACGAYQPVPAYSRSWQQGGPIIEREKLELSPLYDMRNQFVYWSSQPPGLGHLASEDPMPLVAAMRAYVKSKFGNEVDDTKDTP